MDLIKLNLLLETLKKHGVTQYKDAEVFLSLSSQPKPLAQDATPDSSMIPVEPMPTEEQFLYHSCGFDPEEVKSQPPSPEEVKQ